MALNKKNNFSNVKKTKAQLEWKQQKKLAKTW
jgi:hypothetical protein